MRIERLTQQNLARCAGVLRQPFAVIGRLLPEYRDGRWSAQEELFPEPREKVYPDDVACARFLEDMRVQLRQHIEAVRPAASGQALQVFLHERFSPQRAAAHGGKLRLHRHFPDSVHIVPSKSHASSLRCAAFHASICRRRSRTRASLPSPVGL